MARSVADTHTSQSHIMTTHIRKSFTGLEVETGKQAEGRKIVYSASHSKSEPWLQPIRLPDSSHGNSKRKKNLKYVEVMILRDVMESWLPKSTLISNGSLFLIQIEALYS